MGAAATCAGISFSAWPQAQLIERKSIQALIDPTEVFLEGLLRAWIEVYEDQPLPYIHGNRAQCEVVFVEIEEIGLIGDAHQAAVVVVHPAVEFADVVLPTATLIPHQLVASMSADIVEGAYVAAVVAGHQEVGVTNLDMAVAEIARLRNVVRVTDLQPAFTKYSVAFPLEILFGQKPACRQRPGVEFGVACRPPFLFSSEYLSFLKIRLR